MNNQRPEWIEAAAKDIKIAMIVRHKFTQSDVADIIAKHAPAQDQAIGPGDVVQAVENIHETGRYFGFAKLNRGEIMIVKSVDGENLAVHRYCLQRVLLPQVTRIGRAKYWPDGSPVGGWGGALTDDSNRNNTPEDTNSMDNENVNTEYAIDKIEYTIDGSGKPDGSRWKADIDEYYWSGAMWAQIAEDIASDHYEDHGPIGDTVEIAIYRNHKLRVTVRLNKYRSVMTYQSVDIIDSDGGQQ